jgi:hypothetical protein
LKTPWQQYASSSSAGDVRTGAAHGFNIAAMLYQKVSVESDKRIYFSLITLVWMKVGHTENMLVRIEVNFRYTFQNLPQKIKALYLNVVWDGLSWRNARSPAFQPRKLLT